MANKKSLPWFFIIKLMKTVPSMIGLALQSMSLVEKQVHFMGSKISNLVFLSFLLLTLLITTWMCVLSIIFVSLTALQLNYLMSLFIILVLNALFIVIIGLMMNQEKNKLLSRKK